MVLRGVNKPSLRAYMNVRYIIPIIKIYQNQSSCNKVYFFKCAKVPCIKGARVTLTIDKHQPSMGLGGKSTMEGLEISEISVPSKVNNLFFPPA